MKSWYEIDRRASAGTLDRYDMVRATSARGALDAYLGVDASDYTVTRTTVYGRPMLTARCPEKTSGYLEVQRALIGE